MATIALLLSRRVDLNIVVDQNWLLRRLSSRKSPNGWAMGPNWTLVVDVLNLLMIISGWPWHNRILNKILTRPTLNQSPIVTVVENSSCSQLLELERVERGNDFSRLNWWFHNRLTARPEQKWSMQKLPMHTLFRTRITLQLLAAPTRRRVIPFFFSWKKDGSSRSNSRFQGCS